MSLSKYKGFVTIIVNVASQCGLTKSNYEQLNQLYEKHAEAGLKIAAFPCNQFAAQEPGDGNAIQEFCTKSNVKFDLYEKIDVNGNNSHPLYKFLKHKQGGLILDAIKWNFTKFLINKQGIPIKRYGPTDSPNVSTRVSSCTYTCTQAIDLFTKIQMHIIISQFHYLPR